MGGKIVLIPDNVSIDLRPDVINHKEGFGDWVLRSNRHSQIDTIVEPENKGTILTVTESTTGFLLMKKLPMQKNAKTPVFFLLLYKQCIHSISPDNGSEFYEHKLIAKKLNTEYFFAHPYSSEERGVNEYTNCLTRKYIPEKQIFNNITEDDIKLFQTKINKRPRKLLNFETPKNRFFLKVVFAT